MIFSSMDIELSHQESPPAGASPQELKSAWELRGKRSSPRQQDRQAHRTQDDDRDDSLAISVDDESSETASFISKDAPKRPNKNDEQHSYDVLDFSFSVYVLELVRFATV